MTDQVEAELKSLGTQALQDLMNNLTQAKGFVLGQAPEFCQQLVARQYVEIAGWTAFGCALGVLAAVLWKNVFRKHEDDCMEAEFAFFRWTAAIVFTVPATFLVISGACNFLRLYVAPKVFLVEEIARMLK